MAMHPLEQSLIDSARKHQEAQAAHYPQAARPRKESSDALAAQDE